MKSFLYVGHEYKVARLCLQLWCEEYYFRAICVCYGGVRLVWSQHCHRRCCEILRRLSCRLNADGVWACDISGQDAVSPVIRLELPSVARYCAPQPDRWGVMQSQCGVKPQDKDFEMSGLRELNHTILS